LGERRVLDLPRHKTIVRGGGAWGEADNLRTERMRSALRGGEGPFPKRGEGS